MAEGAGSTNLTRRVTVEDIPATDFGRENTDHGSLYDMHRVPDQRHVTFFDISVGNGQPVIMGSKVEVQYTGTLLDLSIWGKPQRPVSSTDWLTSIEKD